MSSMTLPMRDGVSPSCIALPDGSWPCIIDFLVEHFDKIPRDEWVSRMACGDVVDAAGATVTLGQTYRANQKLFYYRRIVDEAKIPFDETILFRDDYLLVVDKPHFLPVIPAGKYLQETLLVRLRNKLGVPALAPIHRIDRETAGLVMFTLQANTRGAYQALFSRRLVKKTYEAIAPICVNLKLPIAYKSRLIASDSFMQMREVEGEPNAETHIELIEVIGENARYKLQPVTGKRHQLRVQMAALGMPILNDQIYPVHLIESENNFDKPLQLLAQSLEFVDPISGQSRKFESGKGLTLNTQRLNPQSQLK